MASAPFPNSTVYFELSIWSTVRAQCSDWLWAKCPGFDSRQGYCHSLSHTDMLRGHATLHRNGSKEFLLGKQLHNQLTKPHSFFLKHMFSFRYNSNFVRTNMQQFSRCSPCPPLSMETPFCSDNRRKDCRGEFSNRRPLSSGFPQLKHDFFLTAFCQLKFRGFELSSQIWKLLSPYGHIVSGNLRRNAWVFFFFSHKSHRWTFRSKLYLTRNRAEQHTASVNTDWLAGSSDRR
jgi:hypothetical protein